MLPAKVRRWRMARVRDNSRAERALGLAYVAGMLLTLKGHMPLPSSDFDAPSYLEATIVSK